MLGKGAMFVHAVQLARANIEIGAYSSFIKLFSTETAQELADLLLEDAGPDGANSTPFGRNLERLISRRLGCNRGAYQYLQEPMKYKGTLWPSAFSALLRARSRHS